MNTQLTPFDEAKFFEELKAFVREKEGGLSNHPNDTAAAFPSPTPQKYHTNIGVTWQTFTDSAKTLGYTPTVENFLNMPGDIWTSIFMKKYMAKVKDIKINQVLKFYIGLWYWGGTSTALIDRAKTALKKDISDKEKLAELVALRKDYFDRVIKSRPKDEVFRKGWYAVQDKYFEKFSKYL